MKPKRSNGPVWQEQGGATSAAKMNGRPGTKEQTSRIAWFENGKAIEWKTVSRSVAPAYEEWRHRMAMKGVKVLDKWERTQQAIDEALERKRHTHPHIHA